MSTPIIHLFFFLLFVVCVLALVYFQTPFWNQKTDVKKQKASRLQLPQSACRHQAHIKLPLAEHGTIKIIMLLRAVTLVWCLSVSGKQQSATERPQQQQCDCTTSFHNKVIREKRCKIIWSQNQRVKIKSKQVNRQLSKRHSFRISSGCWKSLISNHWNRLYTHARTVRRPNAMFPNIIQISRLAKTVIELVRIKKDREKQRERGLFLSNPPWRSDCSAVWASPTSPCRLTHDHTQAPSHRHTLLETPKASLNLLGGCSWSQWLTRWHSYPIGWRLLTWVILCVRVCFCGRRPQRLSCNARQGMDSSS